MFFPGGFSLVRGGSPWFQGGSPWSQGVLPGPGGFSLVPGGGGWGLPGPGGGSLETPPVNRITDTCKNITLATTSLRPIKMSPQPILEHKDNR